MLTETGFRIESETGLDKWNAALVIISAVSLFRV